MIFFSIVGWALEITTTHFLPSRSPLQLLALPLIAWCSIFGLGVPVSELFGGDGQGLPH